MFGRRWRLFRLAGIPISLDLSWLVILALLTMTLGQLFPELITQYYPDVGYHVPAYVYWLMAIVAALGFFACILLHELGHAIVARAEGMPIRGITLFMFGGVAEIGDEPPSAGAEFLMAIAGPAVSFVIAVVCAVLSGVGYAANFPPSVVMVLGYLAGINAIVLLFNMVPAFPLDGGRVLRSALWGLTGNLERATWWASLAGQVFSWVLIAWGVLNFFNGNWLGGVWTGLIGLFLNRAAQSSYQQVLIRQALEGETVGRFMNPHPIVVAPNLTLLEWVENYVYRYHRKAFPVVEDGRLVGLMETQALADVPRSEWEHHTVAEFMRRNLRDLTIPPHADALQAMKRMQHTGSSRVLVTAGTQLVGILSVRDLMQFLNLKLALEGTQRMPKPRPMASTGDEGRPEPVHRM